MRRCHCRPGVGSQNESHSGRIETKEIPAVRETPPQSPTTEVIRSFLYKLTSEEEEKDCILGTAPPGMEPYGFA